MHVDMYVLESQQTIQVMTSCLMYFDDIMACVLCCDSSTCTDSWEEVSKVSLTHGMNLCKRTSVKSGSF